MPNNLPYIALLAGQSAEMEICSMGEVWRRKRSSLMMRESLDRKEWCWI